MTSPETDPVLSEQNAPHNSELSLAAPGTFEFDALLDYLKQNRGFDFSGYKRPSLMRRFTKHMHTVGVTRYEDYLDYLQVHPEEFAQLFNTILINVTSFFRDPPAWEYLATEIIPRFLDSRAPNEVIRVWCAGCASGEEAYTVAILLAEAMGLEAARQQVKIYATDADEEALNQARQASYTAEDLNDFPPDLRSRYFEPVNGHYLFHKELRRTVIFGRNDLLQDAPISHIDLLVCRNTLIYFNAEAQAKILDHFYFALNDDGYLFLGKSEMLLTRSHIFTPVDLKRRVFVKVPKAGLNNRGKLLHTLNLPQLIPPPGSQVRLREAAFDAGAVAEIVLDLNSILVLANQPARALFNLNQHDLGRPLHDLEVSYRPVELRSRLQQAYAQRHPISLKNIAWSTLSGDSRYFDIQILPLLSAAGNLLGASIAFLEVTLVKQLETELEHSKQDLEAAYEELQATIEELETTNEELQSSNEELETMNEELQSTNEELETMNEELQSTNEELETINNEMHERTEQLHQANDYLGAILTSLRAGVVVVDQNLQVQIWNRRSEDLWGLRDDEVQGKHLFNLDIGLPVEQLHQPIRLCLNGEFSYQEALLTALTRRGRRIQCSVTCTPLTSRGRAIQGVILLMEDRGEAQAG